MAFLKRPSPKLWLIAYIILPLTPFILGSIIRLITASGKVFWITFNASDLAICLALASLIINQSLLRSSRLLDDRDKEEETEGEALLYLVSTIILVAFFALIVAFRFCVDNLQIENLNTPLHVFEVLIFIAMPIMIWLYVKTQRSFRLRARIL